MKKSILFLCAALVVMFTSCSQDFGDQNEVNGKPGVLSLTIKNSNAKTRAAEEAGFSNDLENVISDILVFTFDGDDNYAVAPQYFPATEFTTGAGNFSVQVQITTSTANIFVVSNLGNPATAGSKAKALLAAISGYATPNSYAALSAATFDLDTDANTAGNLLQSGESTIDATKNTPSASITLEYVNSRISVEKITLFGETTNLVVAKADGSDAAKAVLSKGWDKIQLSSLFILNATIKSSIVGEGTATVASGENAYYTGIDVTPWTSGMYYDDNFKSVSATTTGLLDFTVTTTIPNPGSNPVGKYPYFYVWTNPVVTPTTPAGTTLLVIAAEITVGGSASTYYYSIPIYTKDNTSMTEGVLNRNTHYRITANIAQAGSDNPYDLLKNAKITITPAGYEDQTIDVSFP